LALAGGIMLALAFCQEASAIPAFARKYSMSCATCHAPMPRLKEYGDEFAGNGFVLKDKEAPRYFVETGDKNLSLIRDLPFAIRLEGFVKHDSRADHALDLTAPYNLKLLSGGTLTDNIAYYFYFFLSERGEVAGLEDAFIMFNNLFGEELDLYVGQFQVSDPLFKRELRLTYEDYQVYRMRPPGAQMRLVYDRGVMLTYTVPRGPDVILEVVNGNSIGHADDLRLYDDDKFKQFVGRVSQDVGQYVRLGAFGSYGKEGDEHDPNEVMIGGVDVTATAGPVEVNIQYLERSDSGPLEGIALDDDVVTRGGFVEVVYLPGGDRGRWYAVGLYNQTGSCDISTVDYQTLSGHIGYVLRTNMRVFVENVYDWESEENVILLGLVTAF
jgi:hypothetical protein